MVELFYRQNLCYHNRTLDKPSKRSSHTPQTQKETTLETNSGYLDLLNQRE